MAYQERLRDTARFYQQAGRATSNETTKEAHAIRALALAQIANAMETERTNNTRWDLSDFRQSH